MASNALPIEQKSLSDQRLGLDTHQIRTPKNTNKINHLRLMAVLYSVCRHRSGNWRKE
jgi:hypothetical protein